LIRGPGVGLSLLARAILRQFDVDGSDERLRTVTARVDLSEAVVLSGPSPNPVRSQLSVSFGVRDAQSVQLVLYDVLGRRLRTLYDGTPTPGEEVAVQQSVQDLPSGRYFLRLQGSDSPIVRPVTIVR